jgi:ABC-type dipeptide/oligopeptide/nickel transport system permease subunit
MTRSALATWAIVAVGIAATVVSIDVVMTASYAQQFREFPNAAPSAQFPLGTDALGRDRLSRLLGGSGISLSLATAAALCSTAIAALAGGLAGLAGGRCERIILAVVDLFLSLPWLFLLLMIRALLPLNLDPEVSVAVTFALLGLLGWAAPARVICAKTRSLRTSSFLLHARACGLSPARLYGRHLAPGLKPILAAQFWLSVPIFILSEANLGLLGLGVSEPMPSWGNLLRELENYDNLVDRPWIAVSAVALALTVCVLQTRLAREEPS